MRTLMITGDHRRHRHYARAVHEAFGLCGLVLETRETMTPPPPEGVNEHDARNWMRHFAARDEAELRHFTDDPPPACPTHRTDKDGLNSDATATFVRDTKPDVALVYGTGLIKPPLLDALPRDTLNMHGGLSPRYRGVATLFWPFYFLEPLCAGMTLHDLVAEPDAGDIVHQATPQLHVDDGIHDIACKAVHAGVDSAVRLLEQFDTRGGWQRHRQRGSGKLFVSTDFKAHHLRVNYDLFDDRMAEHLLAGRLERREPKLIDAFA